MPPHSVSDECGSVEIHESCCARVAQRVVAPMRRQAAVRFASEEKFVCAKITSHAWVSIGIQGSPALSSDFQSAGAADSGGTDPGASACSSAGAAAIQALPLSQERP